MAKILTKKDLLLMGITSISEFGDVYMDNVRQPNKLALSVYIRQKRTTVSTARAVWAWHKGVVMNYEDIIHLNGDLYDNSLSNLKVVKRSILARERAMRKNLRKEK